MIILSCQKVIDVDLNEANPNVVIEANYTAEDSTVRVRITMTSSYFNSEPSPEVNDAVVTITDQLGNSQSVPFIANGYYELPFYVPVYNSNYTLSVVADGKTFSAISFMPSPVQLLDITYDSIAGFFGSEGGYVPYMRFNDPLDTINYYSAVLSKNGDVWDGLTQIFTQDDRLTDGNFIERPLFGQEWYQMGDTIGMELRSIDEINYRYIDEIQSIAGTQSGAPANPTTNWSNDALGYFSAYSNSRKTVVIQ